MRRYLTVLVLSSILALVLIPVHESKQESFTWNFSVPSKPAGPPSVETLIRTYASSTGVNLTAALRIAECESRMGEDLFNDASSAKGVYQFIDSTWANYCEGDVLNHEDNIRCFMELYPQHPTWWQCR